MKLLRFLTLPLIALAASAATLVAQVSEGKLPDTGVSVERAGGWLNIEATGSRLVLLFFDKDKRPVAPDGIRATARVVYPAREDRRVVFGREEERLVSPRAIRPPYAFRIHMLLSQDGGSAPEAIVVHYPQNQP